MNSDMEGFDWGEAVTTLLGMMENEEEYYKSSSNRMSLLDFISTPLNEQHCVNPMYNPMCASAGTSVVPTSPVKPSLYEKMMRALFLFSALLGRGYLVRVWVPFKNIGGQCLLSTDGQPFFHDEILRGYHQTSRKYTEMKPGSFPSQTGRVFASKIPEWTSNVAYYRQDEYFTIHNAIRHNVRGSLALPVFEDGDSCCAVLEVVTTQEKLDFDGEMDIICRALKAVDLSSNRPSRLYLQSISKEQLEALTEIKGIISAICEVYHLPLALTWIPCNYMKNAAHQNECLLVRGRGNNPNEKAILCIEGSACYLNDPQMEGFVRTCVVHFLQEGQGVVGKALQSNQPYFHSDVKEFHISDYPLVHHARKFGLCAAMAVCLKSSYTVAHDYLVELFLPVNTKSMVDQEHLVCNIAKTMERLYKRMTKVPNVRLFEENDVKLQLSGCELSKVIEPFQLSTVNSVFNAEERASVNVFEVMATQKEDNGPPQQATNENRKQTEKNQAANEKQVQPHLSGSLSHAEKCLGGIGHGIWEEGSTSTNMDPDPFSVGSEDWWGSI